MTSFCQTNYVLSKPIYLKEKNFNKKKLEEIFFCEQKCAEQNFWKKDVNKIKDITPGVAGAVQQTNLFVTD